jgi:predicted PurR-regulated permease PerM
LQLSIEEEPALVTRTDPPAKRLASIVLPLWIVALALLVAFCYFASSLCITVLIAAVLALVIDPLITQLERLRVPRMISSGVVIVACMLAIGTATYASYKQVDDAIDNMPAYARRIGDAISPFTRKMQKVEDSAGRLNAEVSSKRVQEVKVKADYPEWTTYIIRGVGPLSGVIIIVGVVPFLMFFLLLQKSSIKHKLSMVWGDVIDVETFSTSVIGMVRGFVIGNLIIGGLMALVTIGTLYVLGLHGAVLIGLVSGFANLVPFVGAVLAALIPMAASLFQYQPMSNQAVIFLTAIALHTISANLLIPRFVGRRVSVSPVAATVGILFWGWLWGVVGVLLAVPLTAFVKIVADSHPSLDKIANLLAERPHTLVAARPNGSGLSLKPRRETPSTSA